MKVPTFLLGYMQQPLQSGVSFGAISLLTDGVDERGRRQEPRRDHAGLARTGSQRDMLAWRRKLRRNGTYPLGPEHELGGWDFFRRIVSLRSCQFFFAPACAASANLNIFARRWHRH